MANPNNLYGLSSIIFKPIAKSAPIIGSFSPNTVTFNAGGEIKEVRNAHGLLPEAFQAAGTGELTIEGLNDLGSMARVLLMGGKVIDNTLNTSPVITRLEPVSNFGEGNMLAAKASLSLPTGVYRAVATAAGADATFEVYRMISPDANTHSNFFEQAGEKFGLTDAVTMSGGAAGIAVGDVGIFSVLPISTDERVRATLGSTHQPQEFMVWIFTATGREINPENRNLQQIYVPRFLPKMPEISMASEEVQMMTIAGSMLHDARIGGVCQISYHMGI